MPRQVVPLLSFADTVGLIIFNVILDISLSSRCNFVPKALRDVEDGDNVILSISEWPEVRDLKSLMLFEVMISFKFNNLMYGNFHTNFEWIFANTNILLKFSQNKAKIQC